MQMVRMISHSLRLLFLALARYLWPATDLPNFFKNEQHDWILYDRNTEALVNYCKCRRISLSTKTYVDPRIRFHFADFPILPDSYDTCFEQEVSFIIIFPNSHRSPTHDSCNVLPRALDRALTPARGLQTSTARRGGRGQIRPRG